MRAASLVLVLIFAKLLAIGDREIAWSPSTVAAYVWQDVAVGVAFWVLDWLAGQRGIVASRVLWILYGAIVVLAVIDVPVTRALSSPRTVPMLRAAGAPLLDSFAHYLTAFNIAAIVLVIAAGAVLPLVIGALPASVALTGAGFDIVLAPAGLATGITVPTFGLLRNSVIALVATASLRIQSLASPAYWLSPLFAPAA